tara:strand:- start:402 stop:692 length:291 start_codon:yes stop_codon:yes gene_type:complete
MDIKTISETVAIRKAFAAATGDSFHISYWNDKNKTTRRRVFKVYTYGLYAEEARKAWCEVAKQFPTWYIYEGGDVARNRPVYGLMQHQDLTAAEMA